MALSERYSTVSAFVLHAKPYQETSSILQVFTRESGRISIIAKGLRNKKSQSRKAKLQPFNPLELSFTGKGELKTLIDCELVNQLPSSVHFNHDFLACGFYLNELIIRALPEWESFPNFFDVYTEALLRLTTEPFGTVLRKFEVELLAELGIAPDWQLDSFDKPIDPEIEYHFLDERGFVVAEENPEYRTTASPVYSGKSILALATGEFESQHIKGSQMLTQRLLRQVIGDKPLQSRKMWQHNRHGTDE